MDNLPVTIVCTVNISTMSSSWSAICVDLNGTQHQITGAVSVDAALQQLASKVALDLGLNIGTADFSFSINFDDLPT